MTGKDLHRSCISVVGRVHQTNETVLFPKIYIYLMNFTHAKGVEIEKKNMSILATQLKHEELKRIHNGLACSD